MSSYLGRLVVAAVVPCALSAQAQFTNRSSVVDGGGGGCSNATYRSVTAIAQPCPVGFSQSAGHLNSSGFLQTFVLHPALDTDGDGVVDENDPDNDNDGLDDRVELGGNAFAPNAVTDTQVTDSDSDGAADGQEAGAMTNPNNANSLFAVTAIQTGTTLQLTWKARGGLRYQIECRDDVTGADWGPLGSPVTAVGGSAPWYETSASLSVAMPAGGQQFYRARLVTP